MRKSSILATKQSQCSENFSDNGEKYFEKRQSKQKWHTSAIIRALTRAGGWKLFDNPLDVFLVVYSRERNTSWHLNLPRGAESFAEALQRAEAKDNDKKESR